MDGSLVLGSLIESDSSCGADMRWSAAAPRTPTAEGGERTPGAYLRDHGVPCLWHEDEAAQPRKTQHKL